MTDIHHTETFLLDRMRRERENVEHHLARLFDATRSLVDAGHIRLGEVDTPESVALRHLAVWAVVDLSKHLPVLAEPWVATDVRDEQPVRLVRKSIVDGTALVTVKRGPAKRRDRGRARWLAYYMTDLVSPDGDDLPIDWPTMEDAKAACDARLAEEGVRDA